MKKFYAKKITRYLQIQIALVVLLLVTNSKIFAQNPLTSAQDFNIFTEGNLTITAGDIEGAVAVGGNLVVMGNSQRTSANTTGGQSYVNINGLKYAVVVGGGLSGVSGGNIFKIDGKSGLTDDHYVSFYSLLGSTAAAGSGGIDIGNPVTTVLNRYVRINSTAQSASTVQNSTSLVNFSAAFTDFRSQAVSMSGCTSNVTATVSGGQATLNLGANSTNVWTISGSTLNTFSQINLTGNLPSATRPLVINVNASGTFSWSNVKFVISGESDNYMEINRAPYIIWNFYNATTLTIANSNLILGSVFAPNAAVTNNGSGNITGQLIAKSFTKPYAGELHIAKFNASVACAATSCTCAGNLVANPSFENGTTGWGWSGGTLSAGTGAVSCGSYSGDFQISNTSSNWVSQTIGTDLPAGTVINASVYAGTHDNSYYHEVGVYFFDANWNWISGSSVEVNKILANAPVGPQLYTWTAVVPAGAKYTQVGYSGNGNWIKTDQWCVTLASSSTVAFGNQVYIDLNGNGIKDGSDWGYDGITVKLYADANEDGVPDGAALATTITNGGGYYNFANLAPGKYMAQIESAPSWMYVIPKNGGDPDNNIDDDNNGLSQSGTTIKGGTITLTTGGEPGGTNYNGTYDFAVYKDNGLGDFVFLDANSNGIQDAGETGIEGVTVKLKNTSGTVLATTTTDATGYYYFWDPSQYGTTTYNIEFVTPTGYSPSPSNQGSDDNKDSDPVNGVISNVTVPYGTWNNSLDAGFTTTLSLGNRVWYDANNNGINDSENGIAGVTVNLYSDANNDNVADGTAIKTTTTDANGYYQFDGLAPGNYIVGVVTPAGYVSSAVDGGDPDNNNNLDDNGQVTVGNETRGLAITLAFGTEPLVDGNTNPNNNITYDFGFLPDCDCTTSATNLLVNGSFENGTTGWNWSGGTLTTGTGYIACGAANGFNNWSTGTSKVWQDVAVTAGATVTFNAYAGTHTAGLSCAPKLSLIFLNSSNVVIGQTDVVVTRDVDANFGQLAFYSITAVAPAGTVKARVQSTITCNVMKMDAFCLTATIPVNLGNYVWYDRNNNGTQDAGEPVISGATVKLYADANGDNTPDGAAIATTTTDAGGLYAFTGLAAGKYIVAVTLPAGYAAGTTTATSASPDNDNNTDNNAVTTVSGEVRSNYITLTAGAEPTTDGDGNNGNLTLDFGLKGTGSIGDKVWNDANGNGIQDVTESGISGVTVTLTYPGGATVTTTTDANGNYLFSNLAPGSYTVSFTTPSGYTAAPANQGSDDTKDSDPVSGSVSVTLAAAENNLTVDAGFMSNQLVIGNYVWNDANNNGTQDASETGISGATVKLYVDANGDNTPDAAAVATTTTNASGAYTFTGLTPGNYIVGVVLPTGYAVAATTATSASPNNDNNTDNNGVTTVSGEVRSNYSTLAAGAEPTTDGDGSNGNLTLDFGLKGTGSIGDKVWNDVNGNGIQDAGEAGISGVTVTLTYPDASTVTATTDANGNYLFSGLVAGNYSVSFTTPTGFVAAPSNQGSDDTKDSDPVSGNVSVLLAAGENNLTVDAGFMSNQLVIGNYVWSDVNNNGTQDAGEPGIGNVTVKLYADANGDNTPDAAAIATTTTNAAGSYTFTGLTPGNYIVAVTTPSGYVVGATTATSATPNNDNNTDNNGVTTVGGEVRSNYITLTAGGEPTTDGDGSNGNLTVDFGFRGTLNLGNVVWADLNDNGIYDANEVGINGVTVNLYVDANDDNQPDDRNGDNAITAADIVATTTTSGGGVYQFNYLGAGNYIAGIVMPSGYVAGVGPVSINPNDDVNNDDNGIVLAGNELRSNFITLSPFSEPTNDGDGNNGNLTLDFGVTPSGVGQVYSLSGNLFYDANRLTDNTVNGYNITPYPTEYVLLINATTGKVDAIQQLPAVLSANEGKFSFTNLPGGTTYYVMLSKDYVAPGSTAPVNASLPAYYYPTGEHIGASAGSDGTIDSKSALIYLNRNVTEVNFGIVYVRPGNVD